MAERHGVASWPGVVSLQSATYCWSSGIYPGTAQLVILPQTTAPAVAGSLVLSDGVESITLTNCKLDDDWPHHAGDGTLRTLLISDRRWKWRETGAISGDYNIRDEHGYLLLWTLKTPTQLAKLCLEAMGETDYTVLMPDDFYPEVKWDATNPASALQQLAEDHGCAVVYRINTDTVLVTKRGEGADLPTGSISMLGAEIKVKDRPDRIDLYGAPLRYQTRMVCEAVGKEWDGRWLPIHLLSYAPSVSKLKPQITDFKPTAVSMGDQWSLTVSNDTTTIKVTVTAPDNTLAGLCDALNNALAVQPGFLQMATVLSLGGVLTITGNPGVPLKISADIVTGSGDFVIKQTQAADDSRNPWAHSDAPSFANVQATDQLTRVQAIDLAQKCVFRCYRVTGTEPDLKTPLTVPGYGKIVRLFQLLLSDHRVEQIDPKVPKDILPKFPEEKLRLANLYYDGWSRDQPAVAFGSYWRAIAGKGNGTNDPVNSPAGEQILVSFSVDPEHYLIEFEDYVRLDGGGGTVKPAVVYLDCAVQVRDSVTNAIKRFQGSYTFPGPAFGTGPKVIRHDDVQQNFIGQYDPKTQKLTGVKVDIPDTDKRATYYLLGEAVQWLDQGGSAQVHYNGIRAIAGDGAIQQVTWNVGPQGATTQASRNSDHSPYVPNLPERRRLDHLSTPAIEARAARLHQNESLRQAYEPL